MTVILLVNYLGDVPGFARISSGRLKQELQSHPVSVLAFQQVVDPANFQQCRNVDRLVRKGDIAMDDRPWMHKLIAEHANSAFGYVLCLGPKCNSGSSDRFHFWKQC